MPSSRSDSAQPAKRLRLSVPAEKEDDEESEQEESEEEELELTLDEDGRVYVEEGGEPMDFNFRPFPSLLRPDTSALDVLRRDCAAAFTARAARDGSYSQGETFWVPANAQPVSALERLAQAIFRLHAEGLAFDPARSGAEWWTQVIDTEDDIGWHWDRDYTLEADTGQLLHPHLATVTYLNEGAAPTVILEILDAGDEKNAEERPDNVVRAHLSRPAVGKHIAFDGRWLHGAPADLAAALAPESGAAAGGEAKTSGGKRVTFLVNVWLNHKPIGAAPFSSSAASLSAPESLSGVLPLSLAPRSATAKPETIRCESGIGLHQFEWDLGAGDGSDEEAEEEEREHDHEEDGSGAPGEKRTCRRVRLALPMEALSKAVGSAGRNADSVTVEMAPASVVPAIARQEA
eukprot:TRINITY_DN3810_c0_g1_i3.p1 TRINITY_DN3810_c0_g1~~TRINITY_DN3810_c0_g1_i3.p1  ORF type:complete len:404 (+),score=87.72 TRINITY_DN3810_c0_g1_i3:36-1247(+)